MNSHRTNELTRQQLLVLGRSNTKVNLIGNAKYADSSRKNSYRDGHHYTTPLKKQLFFEMNTNVLITLRNKTMLLTSLKKIMTRSFYFDGKLNTGWYLIKNIKNFIGMSKE